ncbi:hypothetical protein Nepgr_008523 [Nepenthes gracilis]|uniref:Uncharacterized protein n=1 Tax=Nepenthes gracilis TaxID=150966 RepID=A0AAD3S934_NEPGR|nr:hypothetical protein Nepgr_008523 [Nepenthes gracilis]
MQMLNSGESDDVFFDSVDYLSLEESVVAEGDDLEGVLGYELWKKEPASVKERREIFLHKMGFAEFSNSGKSNGVNSAEMGSGRIVECNGAVSTSYGSSTYDKGEESLFFCGRDDDNGEANFVVEGSNHDQPRENSKAFEGDNSILLEECRNSNSHKKKMGQWWKQVISKSGKIMDRCMHKTTMKSNPEALVRNRTRVRVKKKMFKEMSALFVGQEIQAHRGIIWTMKFSPDGQYLASGGQDGVVRIWHVTSTAANTGRIANGGNVDSCGKDGRPGIRKENTTHVHAVIPDEIFQIEELPLQEFHGHVGDVLDLAWSNTNCLLSSSMDKTVRLWQVGCNECLHVFHHIDYVTCVQFSPIDDGHFISGSIDGKVRVWGVLERRVLDWVDVRDAVTAICYQPNGKGFLVGSVIGTCWFYETLGSSLQLNRHFQIHGSKKSFGNRITCIQFSQDDSWRAIILSKDSKIRIFDIRNFACKYQSLPKTGSRMPGLFTSNLRTVVSVGKDSRIYIWNYDSGYTESSSRRTQSITSCEHFRSEGACVAVPWSVPWKVSSSGCLECCRSRARGKLEAASGMQEYQCFSLGNWFSRNSPCRDSIMWPEEILPPMDLSHDPSQPQRRSGTALSATWVLVIATAGLDGTIRTFLNYRLPIPA